ncbi:MAG: SusC/RagA family TonB-linked outer membrane protein [Bacteroidetes bacterium]|nr:SusC/RagA family TonB-linked outer membrane protein [Bacteroidota bacterium]
MRKRVSLFACLVLCSILAISQTKEVTGKIMDAQGTPVSGATIKIKGANGGTSANVDGTFRLNVSANATLIVSSVGFESTEVKVGESNNITVTLKPASNSLNEVVVTALGIRREKRMLTYTTQEVKGAAVVDAKQDNIVNALAGKVSGVQITNSSGQPGSSSQIVIRGNSSLTGNNGALFVIDGIPMDNSEAGNPDGPLGAGGTSNRGIDLDPNIIESITVLKGAAATAIYGSSASRGAIVITTKNGRGGGTLNKPVISLSSSYTFAQPLYPELQRTWAQGSGGKYVDGNNGQFGSASWGPRLDTLKVNGQPVPYHDALKEFFRMGHTTDNNVSVSGASDRSSYVVSYSFLKNDGIVPTTDYVRNSFFAKYSTKLSNKINLSTQFNYIHSDNNRTLDGNSLEAPLWTVLSAPISWDPYPTTNPDGTQRVYRLARNNPYWLLDNTGLKDKVDRIIPVVNLSYSPMSWLTITERLGGDMYYNPTEYHENVGTVGSYPTGRLYNRAITYQQWNNDLIVDAKKNFNKDWFGELLLGNNILVNYNDNKFVQGVGLSIPGFYNIGNATTVTSYYNYYKNRKVGFYAQANVEYRKMLTLGLTGRYDGSSVLSSDKQFYPYGSASLGFIFTEALGMNANPILNFGKIRTAYSIVGNDAVPPYSLTNPYYQASIGNITFPFNGQNGYLLTTTYGYPLKNETVKEFEIGLETKWFNNRVSFDATYFNKKSSDLLTAGVPLDPSTGFSSATENSGSMRNKGVELTLGITPVKTKDLRWDVTVNFTKIKNDVLDLAPGVSFLQFAGFTNPGIFAFANSPYGVIYGTHFKRGTTGKQAGQLLLDDDGYPQIADDLAPIGNATPDWIGGLTSELNYKNFLFSFVLDMKRGGNILNLDGHYLDFYGTSKITENRNDTKIFPGIIESTGEVNTKAVPTNQAFYQNLWSNADENSLYDASFLKLRQVTLGYRLPLPKTTVLKSLYVNVTGTNFILHKNYPGADPEVSLNGSGNGQGFANFMTPTSKNFIIALKATF